MSVGKPENRVEVLKKYNSKCAYCGDDLTLDTLHIDHIEPLRRTKYPEYNVGKIKGDNAISNYNPCCRSCNSSKKDCSIEEWRDKISKDCYIIENVFPRYRLLLKFGLIVETRKPVIFHFENINNG